MKNHRFVKYFRMSRKQIKDIIIPACSDSQTIWVCIRCKLCIATYGRMKPTYHIKLLNLNNFNEIPPSLDCDEEIVRRVTNG